MKMPFWQLVGSVCVMVAAACAQEAAVETNVVEQPQPAEQGEANMVIMKTSKGDITIELHADKAPETVKNFLQYVDQKFYDGTIFHRVISSFMIQGGGFTPDMQQKPTSAPVRNEAANGLKNMRGTLAMARTSDPHSATAQFFINVVDNDFLNHTSPDPRGFGYCVFGKVTAGMDVVDAIKGVKTGNSGFFQDVPEETVQILEIRRAGGTP